MNQLSFFSTSPAPSWSGGPMLLERYVPELASWPALVEQKVDGVRCLVVVDEAGRGRAYSRQGLVLPVQALADRVAGAVGAGVVVDGELAASTWNETISLLRRRGADRSALILHAFDLVMLSEWTAGRSSAPLADRRERLQPLQGVLGVRVVPGVLVDDAGELDDRFRGALAAGWEGLVVKDPSSGYYCGTRCRAWAKLKAGAPCSW